MKKSIVDAVNQFKGEINDSTLIIIHDGRGCYESSLPEIVNDFYELTCTVDEFNKCVEEMTTNCGRSSFKHLHIWIENKNMNIKPIYTKEMVDAGVIVEAGMLFATEASEYTAEYTNKKSIVFTDEDGYLIAIARGYAKPVTPPIELIDGKAYQFTHMNGGIFLGFYRESRNSFFAEKVNGNKICGKIEASKIQLLEVAK